MSPLNLWTWGGEVDCSTERMSPLSSVGREGEKTAKEEPTGDGMECPPPLCWMSHLR